MDVIFFKKKKNSSKLTGGSFCGSGTRAAAQPAECKAGVRGMRMNVTQRNSKFSSGARFSLWVSPVTAAVTENTFSPRFRGKSCTSRTIRVNRCFSQAARHTKTRTRLSISPFGRGSLSNRPRPPLTPPPPPPAPPTAAPRGSCVLTGGCL